MEASSAPGPLFRPAVLTRPFTLTSSLSPPLEVKTLRQGLYLPFPLNSLQYYCDVLNCVLPRRHAEVLTPGNCEWDLIWK